MEPFAYGPLGLRPWDLMRLQPQEFDVMVEAYLSDRKRRYEVQAYFTSLIIAPHVKKNAMSVEKILKPLLPEAPNKTRTRKNEKAYFEQMLKNIETRKAARKRGGKDDG